MPNSKSLAREFRNFHNFSLKILEQQTSYAPINLPQNNLSHASDKIIPRGQEVLSPMENKLFPKTIINKPTYILSLLAGQVYSPHIPPTTRSLLLFLFLESKNLHTKYNISYSPFVRLTVCQLQQHGMFILSITRVALFASQVIWHDKYIDKNIHTYLPPMSVSLTCCQELGIIFSKKKSSMKCTKYIIVLPSPWQEQK